MDFVKLRLKLGANEFEGEGPRDLVLAELERWQQLAGLSLPGPKTSPGLAAAPRLFAVDAAQRSVGLRVTLSGQHRNSDAALLLLYGHHACLASNGATEVSAQRLKAALIASGHQAQRIDRVLEAHLDAGLVRQGGSRKHKTYVLTQRGEQYAARLANRIAAQL